MRETYFEYYGGTMSAEEYAATLGARGGGERCADETPAADTCHCHHPVKSEEEGCCCRKNFRTALSLLGESPVAELMDFDQTAFITDHYAAGVALSTTVGADTPADNLTGAPAGLFRRFSPCNCDLLEISAEVYAVPETLAGITATRVNLCELVAVTIDLADTEAEGELTAEQVAARNFRWVRRYITRRLSAGCEEEICRCACTCGEDCCCAAGLLEALGEGSLSRQVTLAAGPLLLSGVDLLGAVGNVLVLANDEAQRLYFVCVTTAEFFT